MSDKYVIIILNWLVLSLLYSPVQAQGDKYIYSDTNETIVKRIDEFFLNNPDAENVIWMPKIRGLSRFSFSIPKEGYRISKRYKDTNDLFYMSEQKDNGLAIYETKIKKINFLVSEEDMRFEYSQNIFSNIDVNVFIQSAEKAPIGIIAGKYFKISNYKLGKIIAEKSSGEYPILKVKFVNLLQDERSELYANIFHKLQSDDINFKLGYKLFDISNRYNFTVGLQQENDQISSELYINFLSRNAKYQIGFNKIKDISNMNLFFEVKLENIFKRRKLYTNLELRSKNNFDKDDIISLKDIRKQNLDFVWRNGVNLN